MYPYGQTADIDQLTDGSGLDHQFNYVRNSVKAVVDAYDGTVDFYVMPGDDPIIEAYREAFPSLFTDFEDMPDDAARTTSATRRTCSGCRRTCGPATTSMIPDSFYSRQRPLGRGQRSGHGRRPRRPRRPPTPRAMPRVRPARPVSIRTTCSRSCPAPRHPEFVLLRPFVPTSSRRRRAAAHRVHGRQERPGATTGSCRSS